MSSVLGRGRALLDTTSSTYFSLNSVGAAIWDLLATPHTMDALVAKVRAQFDVDESTCRRDVIALIDSLRDAGLVTELPAK